MAVFKCKMCGGDLNVTDGATVCTCAYCGTKQTLPKMDDEKRVAMFERANYFWRNNEFDKAMGIYEMVLATDDTDAEAYWSIVLCRYGIEYVEDPKSHKRVPTVNRFQTRSILHDTDYLNAIKYANAYQKDIFETEAAQIDTIQKNISTISKDEKPYDIFICYKETNSTGERTHDSVYAQKIYDALTQEGLRVFFSRITLEDKIGTAYEPYIYAALHSAKIMLVVGLSAENMNAPWVKNEWDRYLAIIKQDNTKVLIPCYKDMSPYEMPEEFTYLQAQDMGKIGFLQDLVRGVKKILAANAPTAQIQERTVQTASEKAKPLLERAYIFLADNNWKKANQYAEKVLDLEPRNTDAYLCKFLAAGQYPSFDSLKAETSALGKVVALDADFYNAVEFANEKQKANLDAFLALRTEAQYQEACQDLESHRYRKAKFTFDQLGEYKDAAANAEACGQQLSLLDDQNNKIEEQRTTITDLNHQRSQLDLESKNNSRAIEQTYQTLQKAKERIKKTKTLLTVTLCNWITGCLACLSMLSYTDSAKSFGAAMVVLYFCINVAFIVLWIQYLDASANYTKNRKTTEIILSFLFPFIFHIIALIKAGKDIDIHQSDVTNIQADLTVLQFKSDAIGINQHQIDSALCEAKDQLETASSIVRQIRGESDNPTKGPFGTQESNEPERKTSTSDILKTLLEPADETEGW